MKENLRSAKTLFWEAIEKHEPKQWSAFLDQACCGDAELRRRVEVLLELHQEDDSILDQANRTVESPIAERPGAVVGQFKLMEQIGEGGMGVVFVAEQQQPIRRKAALKVIKPGMDSKSVVTRFEAERQALALMDHPNIAKVLDAGSTESGRPYFAMELVRGIPITDYCDQNRLTIRERLALFTSVCQAIQHAHQKGIIHRDIKPSNVLVTLHDGKPVPKVIDFGVAKALNTRLTDKTIYTEHMQIIGTLLYMSPEQAELSGLDIDTRSDLYSLGVLLYELLTGTTPFQQEELNKAGFDEQRKIIREREPERASVRISGLGATVTSVADCRKTDPRKLNQLVRGDLDWIVLKAMEKDRTRRYENASALAEDVDRFLSDEPVQARPPSKTYRLRKYIRRNRAQVAAATTLLATLLLGLAGTTVGLLVAVEQGLETDRQRIEAERQRQIALDKSDRLQQALADWRYELIDRGLESAFRGDLEQASSIARKAEDAEAPAHLTMLIEGIAHSFHGDQAKAIECLQQSRGSDPTSIASTVALMMVGHHDTRSPNDYEELRKTLAGLSVDPDYEKYDRTFLAWSKLWIDPQETMELLKPMADNHSWSILKIMLAQAQSFVALDRDDEELAADAIRNAEYAYEATPDSLFARITLSQCYEFSLALAQQQGNTAAMRELEQSTYETLELLKGHGDHWQVPGTIAAYYELTDDSRADDAWGRVTGDWWLACSLGALDSRRKTGLVSIPSQDAATSPFAAAAQAKLKALSGKGEEARADYEAITTGRGHLPPQASAIEVLLLSGARGVEEEARRLLAQSHSRNAFTCLPERLQFLAGELQGPELLELVKGSKRGQCYAHYLIGLKQLADGNHDLAQESFESCIGTGHIYVPQYYWAKAMSRRIRDGRLPPHLAPSSN